MPDRFNRTPKVAVVCHSHPSVSKGGAEVAAYALYSGLRDIGVDAIFVCACSEADRGRLAFSSDTEFAVYYDPSRYEHFYHLSPPTVERQLTDIIASQRVQVVNFHHFLCFGVNALRAVRALPGVRCYYTIHEFLAMCHHHGQMVTRPAQTLCSEATAEACTACYPEFLRTQFAMRKSALLDLFAGFDGYISPSRFLADRFAAWGFAAARMVVIENGLKGMTPVARRAPQDDLWTFGYFGQINPFKGVDVIVAAAELLATDPKLAKTIRIRIHGNLVEPSAAFLERFAKAQRDLPFLSYAGPYDTHSVYRLMSDCDYVIVPSKWWENSPVVIQEAYAVKTPVIASAIGGLAEKVANGISGLHFKLGDPLDLLRVMRLATDLKMSEKLRAGIPAVASDTDMARDYLRVFSERAMPPAEMRAVGDAR